MKVKWIGSEVLIPSVRKVIVAEKSPRAVHAFPMKTKFISQFPGQVYIQKAVVFKDNSHFIVNQHGAFTISANSTSAILLRSFKLAIKVSLRKFLSFPVLPQGCHKRNNLHKHLFHSLRLLSP